MALFKKIDKAFKRFRKGDLVYDDFYGSGIIIDTDVRFGELKVSFKDERVWLTPVTVESLQLVSRHET